MINSLKQTEIKLFLWISVCLPGCKEEEFTWNNYLKMTKAQVAPKELFSSPGRVSVFVLNDLHTDSKKSITFT